MMFKLGILGFALSALLFLSGTAFAQKDTKAPPPKPISDEELRKLEKTRVRPPSGAMFYLGPVEGAPGRFSMLLTDDAQSFVEESYLGNQLALIEAVMVEAKKFAQNEESVGRSKGITTRFFDKQEPTFMVDVEKAGNISRFYVTIKNVAGKKLTVYTGAIKRGEPEGKLLFNTMLERIQAARSEGQ